MESLAIDSTDGAILSVRVTTRAGRTRVAGARNGALLVKLAAAPVDGAANTALIAFLSKRLDVKRRDLRLVSGERRRDKLVIKGLSADDVVRLLAP